MEVFYIYFAFSFVALTFGSPHVSQYEIKDGKKKDSSLDDKLQLLHNFGSLEKLLNDQRGFGSKLTAFNWTNCGAASDTVKVQGLGITPSPLHFPGPLNVAANFIITKTLKKPIRAALEIEKKVLGTFIKIPCIDNFGSCNYTDVCEYLNGVASQCPKPLKEIGINCQCPFNAKNYTLSKTGFQINASVIPTGTYKIQAKIYQGSAEAGCLKLEFDIE